MNSFRSNNLSLKYQGFAPSGCKSIRIGKFEFTKKMRFWLKIPLTGLIDQVDEGRCYGLDTSSGSGSMGSSSGYGSTGFEPNLDDTLG